MLSPSMTVRMAWNSRLALARVADGTTSPERAGTRRASSSPDGPASSSSSAGPSRRTRSARISTSGAYGSICSPCATQRPTRTSAPRPRARVANSSTVRVLPMPASPSTKTARTRWDSRTASSIASRRARSSSRPISSRLVALLSMTPCVDVIRGVWTGRLRFRERMSFSAVLVARDHTFLDRDELVGEQPVRLTVHALGGCGVRSLDEAEHLARVLVEPVLLVVDAVLALDLEVLGMGTGDGVCGEAFDLVVDVHEQSHEFSPSMSR
ncbi:hypothetical protein AERO9AM_20707 [Aeromicrobium sp. 9AM]|nr:hypothetical protein AERO9AM_20707 [Aeromicrobium sp. 9AM]